MSVALRLNQGLFPFPYFARGHRFNPQGRNFFFFLFFSFLFNTFSKCYVIASFETYLIAENNYPHVLVVLFQKVYILTPSIFDMPLLYSISSLKSMIDMCGSSNFRLRGGRTESDRKRLKNCQLVGPQTYLQWVQRPRLVYSGINCQFTVLFGSKGVQHFPGVGVELNC